MNMIIEPAVLFISDKEWADEFNRERFLDQLTLLLKKVKEYRFLKTCWADEMDAAVWGHPNLTPWLNQAEYRNLILEPLIRVLSQYGNRLEHSGYSCGNLSPSVDLFNNEISEAYHGLLHAVMEESDSALIYPNYSCANAVERLLFLCNKHGRLNLTPVDNNNKWLSVLDLSDDFFWPVPDDDDSIVHFRIAIELYISIKKGKIVYKEFSFSPNFISAISKETTKNRLNILKAISLRLSMNQNSATQERTLKDEPIRKTNNRVRCFRVDNKKRRIHYKYGNSGSIIFIDYDDEHKY